MELISRTQAKEQKLKHYFTGKPCPRNHLAPRFTSVGTCTECSRERAMEGYIHSTEKRRRYSSLSEFVAVANEVHKNKYIYDQFVYTSAHTKSNIQCRLHGMFKQNPTNHIQGKGCPVCASAKVGEASRLPIGVFIQKATAVWGNQINYSETQWTDSKEPMRFICAKHKVFYQQRSNHLMGRQGCTKCNHMKSGPEAAIANLCAVFTEVQPRVKGLIGKSELDIYMPATHMAIEYSGMYWHSVMEKDNLRHYKKYKACEALDIRLMVVYEYEWLHHAPAIRRLIRNALGKSRGSIHARKCEVKLVPHSDAKVFYDKYHVQGGNGTGDHFGLYYKSKLVACMRFTFGINDRGTGAKNAVWTLSRYATRVNVVGGASRLFSAFIKEANPTQVKSFSDNRYFKGGMYAQLGFEMEAESAPDYQVWSPKLGLLPKSAYQRRSIPKRLVEHGIADSYDPDTDTRSEAEMTALMGAGRIYDCGKKKWVWTNPNTVLSPYDLIAFKHIVE